MSVSTDEGLDFAWGSVGDSRLILALDAADEGAADGSQLVDVLNAFTASTTPSRSSSSPARDR